MNSVTAAQAPVATVSIETKPLGARIPNDFAGFSLEVSTAGQGIGAFAPGGIKAGSTAEAAEYALGTSNAPNEAFFRFMRNLGPGILRLGGNSQDNTCWNLAAAPHPDWCKAPLSAADFQLFSRAAKDSGWRLIVGMNLKQNSSAWALDEVTRAIAKEIKPQEIIGLEIGNEPDLFSRDGSRPETYTPADNVKDFLAYHNAFARNATARQYALIGPATCCKWHNAQDLGVFVDGVGAASLKLVTVHSYLLTTCGGRTVSLEELLAPDLMKRLDDESRSLVQVARQRNLPIALAETNSASCGGMPGVSNAFAAALWGLDSLFSAASDGYSGVNFHFSYRPGGSSYNPVDTFARHDSSGRQLYRNLAQPLYYGMYLFTQVAPGKFMLPAHTETTSNIRSYATTTCLTCEVSVVVINKDLTSAGRVSIHVPGRAGAAKLLLLKAPRLDSLASEVTFGGVHFDSEGHIPPPRLQPVEPNSDGNYEFDLPNAAAALLTVPAEHRP
ncbi:MAG TPA: glycosyl hydrolase family 79 C-terminal domain-containing protein [Candidatus Acidoferrum sp.]|nr:glycosyl hydrolase family 79 C-terminal domain-containing protein [Candidatus Acidoferrum sp.]